MSLAGKMFRRLMGQSEQQQAEKTEKSKKKENFFLDKLLFPLILALVGTVVSNHIARQSYYNDIVDKYTTRLKDIVVADKINMLSQDEKNVKKDLASIKKDEKKDCRKKIPKNVLLELHTSRKILLEEQLIPAIIPKDGIPCRPVEVYLQNRKDDIEKQRQQIRGLMNTFTVNTLISLSENDAFISIIPPIFSEPLKNIPLISLPFQSWNIKRRDMIINALRLSQLGLAERRDGDIKFPVFLEETRIGDYSLESDAKINLQRIDLTLGYLNGSTFTKVDLTGAKFNYANLNDALFSESILDNANFNNVNYFLYKDPEASEKESIPNKEIKGITFQKSSVKNTTFNHAKLHGLKATSNTNKVCHRNEKKDDCSIDFSNSKFIKTDLSDADFTNATLVGVDFSNATLTGAKLINANLSNVDLSGAKLKGANLTNANLTNATGIDYSKATICNTTLPNGKKDFIDCSNANLQNQDLTKRDFKGISFKGANLTNTNLTDATGIDYSKAGKICNTTLPNGKKDFIDCSNADLQNQDLTKRDFKGISFKDANLTNANLTDATGIDYSKAAKICNTTLPNHKISNRDCSIN